ncbi:O-antigen ligase C-terminal domain-containing protein [Chitinibacter bivalviorum]|uniref:O-antigen ligase C-terminal domain-containing protein n=1 Tax=Chitinibacter bivalviorum TaxID=2739434 RepID=A0A7H9BK26_9NEIS|nr:Wzy polymerase domain-containing protein [Chitinibacter bivalviorum]QLG88839.1 O-antigen ligase C-terminal domain-containing protein [Chitinibacter bivalviorum]
MPFSSYQLRLYQGLLFLLAAVPCGIPFRWDPNPVFPSELAAFFFCVLITLAGVLVPSERGEKSNPPWVSLMWIAFAGVIGLQTLVLSHGYSTERLYPVIYALGAAGAAWSLARAIAVYGAERLLNMFAWGLLAGAIFNSGLAVPQIVQLIQDGPRLIFGNIGQKNMYGHYLAWGLASAAYLVTQKDELPKWMFWIVATWLALSLAFCGSRSPFLYALAWLPAGLFLWWRGAETLREFGKSLTIAAALIILMQFLAPVVNELLQALLKAKNDVPTGLDRIDSNGSRRLVEWQKAWITFLNHPWLGIGWGAWGSQSIALQVRPEFAISSESVLFTHAHNSILNLMAETGVIGTSMIVAGITYAYSQVLRAWRNPAVMFAAALGAVSILHSLVEYPLWYFHFLGPFAVILIFMQQGAPRLAFPASIARMSWALWGGVALGLCVLGGQLYLKIYPIMDPAGNEKLNASRIATLESMRNNPLIDYYAEHGLSNYIVASRSEMDWKLAILRKQNALRPYPGQMTDQAVLEALSGNQAIAHQLIRQAAFAYPESFDYFYQTLDSFKEPEIKALLKDVDEAREFFNAKLDFKIKRPATHDASEPKAEK